MAKIDLQGTTFTLACLPPKPFLQGKVRLRICVKNDYTDYQDERAVLFEDLEEFVFGMRRLLAGAYRSEYNVQFDRSGIAFDFYPYTKDGGETSREERRANDCVVAVRLLMRSADKRRFIGGVYTLLMHRADVESFSSDLWKEMQEIYPKRVHGRGKFVFAGVSPLGYSGCNYWYLDESKQVAQGDYVWVRMGKHNTEQIVLVDSVRRFTPITVPFDPNAVKRILRKATPEEIEKIK